MTAVISLTVGLATTSMAQNPLGTCGSRNLPIIMEQVPTSWWSWQENNSAMWLWNQYVDIYRYTVSNGTWGFNGDSEFAGWPSNQALQSTWGFSWGTALAKTMTTRWPPLFCSCCRINESDVAFNPAYSWTTDRILAETNSNVIHYMESLLHELGHSWGLQTGPLPEYDFDVPTVMHRYYPASVHPGLTIHAPDAYLLRRNYASRQPALPLTDIAVFSHYAARGLNNTSTNTSTYLQGASITIRGLTVENTGTNAINNAHVRLYLSSNRSISTSDILLGDWYWTT